MREKIRKCRKDERGTKIPELVQLDRGYGKPRESAAQPSTTKVRGDRTRKPLSPPPLSIGPWTGLETGTTWTEAPVDPAMQLPLWPRRAKRPYDVTVNESGIELAGHTHRG